MRIFLSGPMTGLPDANYPAFHAAAKALREAGHEVENPAQNERPPCGSWEAYMRLSIAQLLTCEAVAMLPGWAGSRGAALELLIAEALGMSCRPVEAFLGAQAGQA